MRESLLVKYFRKGTDCLDKSFYRFTIALNIKKQVLLIDVEKQVYWR